MSNFLHMNVGLQVDGSENWELPRYTGTLAHKKEVVSKVKESTKRTFVILNPERRSPR